MEQLVCPGQEELAFREVVQLPAEMVPASGEVREEALEDLAWGISMPSL